MINKGMQNLRSAALFSIHTPCELSCRQTQPPPVLSHGTLTLLSRWQAGGARAINMHGLFHMVAKTKESWEHYESLRDASYLPKKLCILM